MTIAPDIRAMAPLLELSHPFFLATSDWPIFAKSATSTAFAPVGIFCNKSIKDWSWAVADWLPANMTAITKQQLFIRIISQTPKIGT